MKTLLLRLDDETDALLRKVCEQQGMNEAAALTSAIEQLVGHRKQTPAQLAAEFNLIGAFHSHAGGLAESHSLYVKQRLRSRQ